VDKKLALLGDMAQTRLVAVVRSKTPEEALAVARAAAAAGIRFVEITFTVPRAIEVIAALREQSDLRVGAGTVLAPQQAEAAIAAGAKFIVSPTLELNLIPVCQGAGVACFPGAATPTEILSAARARADLVKIFPADLLGGVEFIKQMSGPFPDVRFMVSGGVNLANLGPYVQAGVIGICLGSAMLAQLVIKEGHDGAVRELSRYVSLVKETQNRKQSEKP
jgi:2-dehydro-3-deoxyphosphogluconate aldolase / (4S)-4-hydroxy-2-oxoglutarate aldolase